MFLSMALLPSLSLAIPKTKVEYDAARQSLLSANDAKSFDVSTTLTPLEQQVDAQLVSMRDAYIRKSKGDGTYAPEKYFHTWNLTEIRSEPTFQFLDGLPKGGNLHTHSGSTGSVDWLLTEGLAMEGCFVHWPDEEDPESKIKKGTIAFFKEDNVPEGYSPASELVGRNGFTEELRSYITSTKDIADMDSSGAWKVFNGVFERIGPAMAHRPFYFKYLLNTFDVHFANGLSHIETRALLGAEGLGDLTDLDGNTWSGRDVILTYQEAFETWKSSSPSHANFTFKVIVSNFRATLPKNHGGDFGVATALRKEFRNFAVGFDSVSEEDQITRHWIMWKPS
jgi:adenosine deaminase CECR1